MFLTLYFISSESLVSYTDIPVIYITTDAVWSSGQG